MDYRLNNFTSAVGMIPLPEKQLATTLHVGPQAISYGHALHPGCEVITKSQSASTSRISTPGIDLSFRLFTTKGGSIKQETQVGRIWRMHYPASFKFMNGPALMNYTLSLAPAYAGFKHGIVDRSALAALSSVASTFATRAHTETLPADSRAAVSRLLSRPVEMSRLLLRIAVLYVGAATAESFGRGLQLATLSDDAAPRTIATFSDFATSLEATSRMGEQPIYIGLKSLSEPEIYSRIVRLLALSKPKFTTVELEAAPTVLDCWPPIPGARAYIFGSTDTYPPIAGPIAARDVALYAEHFCRLYGVKDQFRDMLQLAFGFSTRPAGSGAMGTMQQVMVCIPAPAMEPMVLTPLSQATDVLGDEEPDPAMLFAAPQLLAGAMRSAVFLSSSNLVLQQAGGYWLQQPGPSDPALLANYRQMQQMRFGGSATTHAALRMTSELGWKQGFASTWALIGATTLPNPCLHPVEFEECLPFTDSIPSTSALLALLKPVAIDVLVPIETYLTPSVVIGRQSLTDAHYSLLRMRHPVELTGIRTQRGSPFSTPVQLKTRSSYRAAPSDGQFATVQLETHSLMVAFKMVDPLSALESHMLREQHSGAQIYYFWNVPHTSPDVFAQFIEDGYIPPRPDYTVPPPDTTEYITVAPSHTGILGSSPHVRPGLESLRDTLGADYGAIIDAHAEMVSLAGKQLPNATYEAKSRTLTGLLTAFVVDMAPFLLEDNPDGLHALLTWMNAACEDAREWDYRPTSKDQLVQQQAIIAGVVNSLPQDGSPPAPAEPPTLESLHAHEDTPPFTEAQPSLAAEEQAVEHAATGLQRPTVSGPHQQQPEDFQPPTTPQVPIPAPVVPSPTAGGISAAPVSFTAPDQPSASAPSLP
jgi:hypothetical protein